MPEPATSTAASPIDELCLHCLEESNLLGKSEVVAVRAWWERERQPSETLPAFLQRMGVFHRRAVTELELMAQGFARFTIISHLFTPPGFALLRRCAAGGPDAQPVAKAGLDTTRNLNANDTVCNDPPADRDLPATVQLAALPMVGRDGDVSSKLSSETLVGRIVGGCELRRFLGRGAKSLVFEAEDSANQRRVAVKLLAPEMLRRGPNWKQRFLYEAQLAARFDHPLLLRVEAHGEDGEFVYCTMPLMTAGSAREALRNHGPYSAYEATRIAVEIARSLEILHGRGLAHGNVKPSNVFVTSTGGVKLADASAPAVCKLRPGSASPPRATEIASDLRMLAATWHWLLTGRPPGQAAPETNLPESCSAVLVRALAPQRGQGFRSATEVAHALTMVAGRLRAATAPSAKSTPTRPAATIEAGQVLGKCLLTARVGQGSSGIVFRARHLRLNVQVAVKVLHTCSEGRRIKEFRAEAQALAKLNHPNVVRVWDYEDDPEHPYLILEFVEGVNLSELIHQSGRLQPDRAVLIVAQIANGLAAAQRLGIVHRDVKPGNILISHDGTAKLADLGLALAADAMTDKAVAGTFAYMAPEQAADPASVDHRADIYALGATFYHLVTGRVPFQGGTREELLQKHACEAPAPPHDLVPDLDPAVSQVILKMLAKSPAQRFQDYVELLRALSALDIGRTPSRPAGEGGSPGRKLLKQVREQNDASDEEVNLA